MGRRTTLAIAVSFCALAGPAPAADLPQARQRSTAARRIRPPVVVVAPSVAAGVPVGVLVVPEVGAPRAPLPSPTAVVLPGATGVPASVDLSPVFLPQRVCGPGFSPDALGACRRHGELHVVCERIGGPCFPLPSDPIPYGPGAAARLAY